MPKLEPKKSDALFAKAVRQFGNKVSNLSDTLDKSLNRFIDDFATVSINQQSYFDESLSKLDLIGKSMVSKLTDSGDILVQHLDSLNQASIQVKSNIIELSSLTSSLNDQNLKLTSSINKSEDILDKLFNLQDQLNTKINMVLSNWEEYKNTI